MQKDCSDTTPTENKKKASQRRMSEKEIRFNAYAIMAAYEYEKGQTGDKI